MTQVRNSFKHLLLAICVICAICVLSFGQTATLYVPNTTQVVPSGATAALNFGELPIGTLSGAQTMTLTNTGSSTLSSISISTTGGNSSDFAVTTTPSTNCGNGATVAAYASCTINVTFTPLAAGARTTTIQVTSNATTVTFGVTGTGAGYQYGNVIPAAATLTLTAAQSGAMVLMGATTGEVITLPTPSQGLIYEFIITTTNTSNYNEIQTAGSTYLLGDVQECASGIACLDFWADGSGTKALKMSGTASSGALGGYIGSHFKVQGISTTQWEISGVNDCASTCTTAFNNTP